MPRNIEIRLPTEPRYAVGDRIKIKCATRNGWLTGWRKIVGFHTPFTLIHACGWDNFMVRNHEIIGHMTEAEWYKIHPRKESNT